MDAMDILNESSISLNISVKPLAGSCDNSDMIVKTCDRPRAQKVYCCPFCQKTFTQLVRHMEGAHREEADVKKFLLLPKGSKDRRSIQDVLRKYGTLQWNTNAKLNNNELIPSRRPNKTQHKKATDYKTCPNCLGTYTIKSLKNHFRICTKGKFKGQRTLLVMGRTIEGRIHENANERLRLVVFPKLREDEIVRLIRYDWLLICYGNRLCTMYSPHYQENMIRARLRLAGRILQTVKRINAEVSDFASLYHPKFHGSITEAIRNVGKFNSLSNEFGVPETATKSVTIIKQIGALVIAEYIKKDDSENQRKAENFLTLMRTDIGSMINKTVAETKSRLKRETQAKIPSTEDIKRLSTYLDRERKTYFESLKSSYSLENWIKLSELTMVLIIVFNRRRTGETQNITLTDFFGRDSINDESHAKLLETLSDQAKQRAIKYSRMKIRGKKGRTVPVLLTSDITESIELLIHHRKDTQISPKNQYLFALPSVNGKQIKIVEGCNALAKFSKLCGADDPSSLRGTNLRKHMASMCIPMGLNDNMVAEIADFMGHHEKIHRDYYRHNTIDREIVGISQFLESAQGNY